MDFYDDYSLKQLENWVHDAITCTNNSPKEIYDVIKKAVEEEYNDFKVRSDRAYELIQLLNGHMINTQLPLTCDKDDPSDECKNSWNSFWEEATIQDKKYSSQYTEEELNEMCNKAEQDEKERYREYNLREAEYYDKRAKLDITYNGMIAKGYTMTADGFWIKEPTKTDRVVKWQLPVQQKIEEGIDDYYVQFPDDLLEAANLKEGDLVEWIDNNNGTYTLRKVTSTLKQDEC